MAEKAQRHVQSVAQRVQEQVHRRVAAIVTRCLKAVFPEYAFEIEFRKKRGKTEAKLWFVVNGDRREPRDDSGGVRDVAALGLRLGKLFLERPRRRRLVVLDEPFRNIHGEDERRRAANLILTLAKEMDVQFIVTTGLDWLKVGKVIELS